MTTRANPKRQNQSKVEFSPTIFRSGGSRGSASVASPSSDTDTSSKRAFDPLPGVVLKQLATDIEAAGGIQKFSGLNKAPQALASLCNTREDLYGLRGDKLRNKIGKQVHRWVLLHKKGQYVDKVLNRFSVRSAKNKNHRSTNHRSTGESSLSSSDSESESSDNSESESSDKDNASTSSSISTPKAAKQPKQPQIVRGTQPQLSKQWPHSPKFSKQPEPQKPLPTMSTPSRHSRRDRSPDGRAIPPNNSCKNHISWF